MVGICANLYTEVY